MGVVRLVGETVIPEKDLVELSGFIHNVFRKCDLATRCDFGEGRIDRLVLFKTFYNAVIKFYGERNNYYVILDFGARIGYIAVEAAQVRP